MNTLIDYAGEGGRAYWFFGEAAFLVAGIWGPDASALKRCIEALVRMWRLPELVQDTTATKRRPIVQDRIPRFADIRIFKEELHRLELPQEHGEAIHESFEMIAGDVAEGLMRAEPVSAQEFGEKAKGIRWLNRVDIVTWACVLERDIPESLLRVGWKVDEFGEDWQKVGPELRPQWRNEETWTAWQSANLLAGEEPEVITIWHPGNGGVGTVRDRHQLPLEWRKFLSEKTRKIYYRLRDASKRGELKALAGGDAYRPMDVVRWALDSGCDVPKALRGLAKGEQTNESMAKGVAPEPASKVIVRKTAPAHDGVVKVPAGTKWAEVEIEIDIDTLRFRVKEQGEKWQKFGFAELGFADGRGGKKPKKAWYWLLELAGADERGKHVFSTTDLLRSSTTGDEQGEETGAACQSENLRSGKELERLRQIKVVQQKQRMLVRSVRKTLQSAFVGISGDPILKSGGCYQATFNLTKAEGEIEGRRANLRSPKTRRAQK